MTDNQGSAFACGFAPKQNKDSEFIGIPELFCIIIKNSAQCNTIHFQVQQMRKQSNCLEILLVKSYFEQSFFWGGYI